MEFEDVIKKHAKNYYFASLFLPHSVRADVFVFYAFVRFFDDIVDEENNLEKFLEFKEKFCLAIQKKKSDIDLFNALLKVIERHSLDYSHFFDFLNSMEMDFRIKRYQTWQDLERYIYGSAEVIGLMLAKIFGVIKESAYEQARKLGYAMQMTNFLRDFGDDYFKRDRIYFPQEELRKFNISEESIAIDENFIQFVKQQISKIRKIYEEANSGISLIKHKKCRLAVSLSSSLYANILRKIEKNKYDIIHKRAFNSRIDFMLIFLKTIFGFKNV
ncbi:MAG: phytoene/squalene synthase family protein [Patescibacteria group bacterium]|nr:phytoene/squalene synthase family protein [Patescibacteria group bacterium]